MTYFEMLEIERTSHLRADYHTSWKQLAGVSAMLLVAIALAVAAFIA